MEEKPHQHILKSLAGTRTAPLHYLLLAEYLALLDPLQGLGNELNNHVQDHSCQVEKQTQSQQQRQSQVDEAHFQPRGQEFILVGKLHVGAPQEVVEFVVVGRDGTQAHPAELVVAFFAGHVVAAHRSLNRGSALRTFST